MNKLVLIVSFLMAGYRSQGHPSPVDTLVDVGTHRLHFRIVEGEGPPLLLEAGNGDDGSVWNDLLAPLYEATGATLITYDRAGLGKSEIDTATISFQQEVEDLETALDKLGYTDQLFLVSHSFGGFYSTLLATRNPDRIRGAVFIDVALPCFFTPEWTDGFVRSIPDESWSMIRQHRTGLFYVLRNLKGISEAMVDKPMPARIPVMLIAAENPPAMVSPDEAAHWKGCLESFGSQENHRYVLARGTGHKVWQDDAELVIREIAQQYKLSCNPEQE